MIKSKFTTLKYIGQVVMTVLFIFLISLFYGFFLRKQHPVPVLSELGIAGLLLTVILPVIIIYQMIINYRSVIINEDDKTISFKAFISGKVITYDFSYFDGYIDTVKLTRLGNVKMLYLVKDDVVKYKLGSNFYENIDELQGGLKQLKYLGFINYTFALSLKIAFGNPIIVE